jgi:hypothetical protein
VIGRKDYLITLGLAGRQRKDRRREKPDTLVPLDP